MKSITHEAAGIASPLLISYAEAFAPLLITQREALDRMERAEATFAEAHDRLQEDLEAGLDTSTARRVLHETKRLLDEAAQAAKQTAQALATATEQAISLQADELMRGATKDVAASLSRFNLKENDRAN